MEDKEENKLVIRMKTEILDGESIETDKCHICNKTFNKTELERHFAQVHLHAKDKKVKIFHCDLCNKTFNQHSNMKTVKYAKKLSYLKIKW